MHWIAINGDKAVDSTSKILRKIQAELPQFRLEMRDFRAELEERFDKLEEMMAGSAAIAIEARGMAERVKERVKRLEDRQ
jgi:ElaB/YqjD/DUF883 family membrane-anchored ribosome-binding protein